MGGGVLQRKPPLQRNRVLHGLTPSNEGVGVAWLPTCGKKKEKWKNQGGGMTPQLHPKTIILLQSRYFIAKPFFCSLRINIFQAVAQLGLGDRRVQEGAALHPGKSREESWSICCARQNPGSNFTQAKILVQILCAGSNPNAHP